MRLERVTILLVFTLFLVSCSVSSETTRHPMITKTTADKEINQTTADQAVEHVLDREEIIRANAVNSENMLLLAFEVKQFHRFHLQELEKKIKSELKEDLPHIDVVISYDPKIMLEIEKLQEKLGKKNYNEEKLKKDLKRIKGLKKEKT